MASDSTTPVGTSPVANASDNRKAPAWLTIVGVFGLLWNLVGVIAFLWHTVFLEKLATPERLATLSEADRQAFQVEYDLAQSIPVWATSAFAIAVFGGVLGCLFIIMKRKFAVLLLGLSLAGIIVQNINSFGIAKVHEILGPGSFIQPALVGVIGVLLLWVALKAKNSGWLR